MKNSKEELPEKISKIKALAERRFVARQRTSNLLGFMTRLMKKKEMHSQYQRKLLERVHLTI